MKIVIIQEKGRHPANWIFREALNLQRAFERQGHECIVWGLGYANFSTPFDQISQDCDAVLLMENYDVIGWLPDLSKCNKIKLFWSIDSHCLLEHHVSYCKRFGINILLNATEGYLPQFNGLVDKAIWFPNCYPSDLIYPIPNAQKIYNLGFVGNYCNRKPWIDELTRRFGMKAVVFHTESGLDYGAVGNGMVQWLNSFKIGFNRNISDDINYRTFETIGCKTLLFTNYTPGLEKLFDLDKHLVIYNDINDLELKYNYYLTDWDAAQAIIEAGHAHAKKFHTFDVRAKQMADIIEGI